MNKLLASILAATLAVTTGLAIAAPQADLGFDPNRMFFRYITPSTDSGDFRVLPNNLHDPIVLPCDVQNFGGQVDLNYFGAGPTVFPKLTATFFDDQNNPIVSSGCLKTQVLPNLSGNLSSMTAGSVGTNGYTLVSSTSPFCAWLFQPSDLPADRVVRIHLGLTAYPDNTYQGTVIADPVPSNNAHDIYVRRSCSCR